MNNETLHFAQANPWSQDHLSLIFDKRVPAFVDNGPRDNGLGPWERRLHNYFQSEGQQLADALLAHLPGGLIDGLLVALLTNKATRLCVPVVGPKEGGAA